MVIIKAELEKKLRLSDSYFFYFFLFVRLNKYKLSYIICNFNLDSLTSEI